MIEGRGARAGFLAHPFYIHTYIHTYSVFTHSVLYYIPFCGTLLYKLLHVLETPSK
jgi:hypothetical protein